LGKIFMEVPGTQSGGDKSSAAGWTGGGVLLKDKENASRLRRIF